jgi:alkylation response protein AidB-like acyl-CoA dehydrogenase
MIASPEREMFRQLCRKFTEAEIIPHAHDWEEAGIFPRTLYKKAAQVGILGAGYPEAVPVETRCFRLLPQKSSFGAVVPGWLWAYSP